MLNVWPVLKYRHVESIKSAIKKWDYPPIKNSSVESQEEMSELIVQDFTRAYTRRIQFGREPEFKILIDSRNNSAILDYLNIWTRIMKETSLLISRQVFLSEPIFLWLALIQDAVLQLTWNNDSETLEIGMAWEDGQGGVVQTNLDGENGLSAEDEEDGRKKKENPIIISSQNSH